MANLFPFVYPEFRAFDTNGLPLDGGKLSSFYAGTSTPKVTYSDSGLTTPNPVTVTLDAYGEATIYLGSGGYKFNLTDKNGVQQPGWPIDNVAYSVSSFYNCWVDARSYGQVGFRATIDAALAAIGSLNRTLYIAPGVWTAVGASDTNLTIPANINLKVDDGANLTIATTKTLTINGGIEAGPYQTFSWSGTGAIDLSAAKIDKAPVEWFGAVGGGAVDNYVTIQKCIISVGGGPIAALGNFTYKVNSGLVLPINETKLIGGNLNKLGTKTMLDFSSLASGACVLVTGQRCNVDGFRIDGWTGVGSVYNDTADVGLHVQGSHYFVGNNLHISDFAKTGFKAIWNEGVSMPKFREINLGHIENGFGFYSSSDETYGGMTNVIGEGVTFAYVGFGVFADSYNINTSFKGCIWDHVQVALYAEMCEVYLENCEIEGTLTGTTTLKTTWTFGAPIDAPFYIFNGALHITDSLLGGAAPGADPRMFHLDSTPIAYGTGALLVLTGCRLPYQDCPNLVKTTGISNRASYNNCTGLAESTIRRNFQYGIINDISLSSGYYAPVNSKAGAYIGGRYIASSSGIPTTGHWQRGDQVLNPLSAANQYSSGHVCLDNGTFDSATSTCSTDGSTAVITGVTTNDFALGQYVTVTGGFPSASTPYMVVGKTSSTLTLDTNSTSTQVGVTVATVAPVFAYLGQPFFRGTYSWAIGTVTAGAAPTLSADITVTGAALGDLVSVAVPADEAGVMIRGYVKSSNTVKISVYNPTASNWTPGTLIWNVQVTKCKG